MTTSLTRREVDASAVLDAIGQGLESVDTIDDLACLPRFRRWSSERLGGAVDVLVADGRLTESADGRPRCARPDRGAA